MALSRIQELRLDGVVIDTWMTVIPDRQIPNTGDGPRIVAGLNEVASRLSRSYSSAEEYNRAANQRASSVGTLVDFSGATVRLTAAFENNPGLADQLRRDGYAGVDSKSLELDGEDYTLTRWVKRDGDLGGALGTVSAILNLTANPVVDSVTSEFRGNFQRTESSEISSSGVPESGSAREIAREQYDLFRTEAIAEYNQVLRTLNTPFTFFTEEDLLSLADNPAGVTSSFNRSIDYTWYDEMRTVNIVVTATTGGLRILDPPGVPEVEARSRT